jgi:pyrroloquinoline quinone (PQQ) biosynthesis protein C
MRMRAQWSAAELHAALEPVIEEEVAIFLDRTPAAIHLTDPAQTLNREYYIRHRIETVKRIWLTSRTDALALAAMVGVDYEAARMWAPYVSEELGHDLLFLRDLRAYGVSLDDVRATPLFPSTVAMVNQLERDIEAIGALPAVAYSLFVEWNSDRYSERVTAKAERQFGDARERGSRSHLAIDKNESHYATMLKIAAALLHSRSLDELERLIRGISRHFRGYFAELFDETLGRAAV